MATEAGGHPADGHELAQRLVAVRSRIASAGGDPDATTIVAVAKGFGADAVLGAVAAGLVDIGENYSQELLAKTAAPELRDVEVRWHYLGALQRNKLARLAPVVACWHGCARVADGAALARRAPGARVLVQVDLLGGRQGARFDDVPEVVSALTGAGLAVDGLMTVGPPNDPDGTRAVFSAVAGLRRRLGLAELSMGMSDDFEAAVAAGATMLRLGRVLFGPRTGLVDGAPTVRAPGVPN